MEDGIKISADDLSVIIGKAILITIDVASEQLIEDVSDKLLENVHEQIKDGRFETHGGNPVYGFFDTGRFSSTIDTQVIRDDLKRKTIHVGSTSKDPNPQLVEFGSTPRNLSIKGLQEKTIINWVIRKKIATGLAAVALGKIFYNYIKEHGISPRPIFRNAKRETESQFEMIANASISTINMKANDRLKKELMNFDSFAK